MSGDGTSAGSGIPRDRAVVDRIVDGSTAVLLVGAAGDELLVPAGELPDGVGEGAWVVLDLDTDPPTVVGADPELTETRAADVTRRLDRIRRERGGGRFER